VLTFNNSAESANKKKEMNFNQYIIPFDFAFETDSIFPPCCSRAKSLIGAGALGSSGLEV